MVTGRLRQRSWETPEGDKRSVTEIEADEVGASLKWATAKVERTSQRGNGDRSQGRERPAERGGDFNDAPADLLKWEVGTLGLQPVGFQGAGRSLHKRRCHSGLSWLENGCAVLPAPDREWLHRGLSLPQVGLPSWCVPARPTRKAPGCR